MSNGGGRVQEAPGTYLDEVPRWSRLVMGVWNRPIVAVPRWFMEAQSSLDMGGGREISFRLVRFTRACNREDVMESIWTSAGRVKQR